MKRFLLAAVLAGVLSGTPANATVYKPTIYIPRIHLYMHLASELDQGPVEWYSSRTTVAIAGHRTWYPHPFTEINELRVGDLVRFDGKNYHVRSHAIVRFDQTWVLNYHGLVLSACSKLDGLPTSAEYRYVVFAS